ncbi:MAG: RNA methyltransferase [Chloroflexi bacterium]|nr:RNA methyltransferase [Chloroflexota bacterium]
MSLELRNAHSVLAALHARPDDVEEVRLPPRPAGLWRTIADLARESGAPTRPASAPGDRRDSSPKQGREGAACAIVAPRAPAPIDALLARPAGGPHGLWLALDSIQDPRNVGAIFRSAAFFGVRGVVLGEHRAAGLTAVAYDTASGGIERVPFAVETNLRRALSAAKDAGLWILGTSEHAAQPLADVPRDRDWLLVVGGEERGLRRLTLEACDAVCAIPSPPAAGAGEPAAVRSLNVSVATGVALAILSGLGG